MDENSVQGPTENQPREIVLTYRGEDTNPVQLRYERELPESMRQRYQEEPEEDDRPLWRRAIDPPEKPQKSGRWAGRVFVVVCLAVALVCLGVGLWALSQSRSRSAGSSQWDDDSGDYLWEWGESENAETTIDTYRPYGSSAATLELHSASDSGGVLTAGEVYAAVRPSTVTVTGTQSATSVSVGTGIIFSDDGYILTNYHVIAGSSACEVGILNEYGVEIGYEALLVGGDEEKDLAVLKVDAQGLTPAQFGVSDELSVGDKVYAIGNPLGLELRATFTDGIVSAVDRDMDVDGVTMTLIQTNAALNSGNSGGPLINEYGQVVGINTIKIMSGQDTIEGLGFAIPTSLAVRWVNEIIQYGYVLPQPVLGVTISRIPETLPDGSIGLRVESVTSGGSGDRAGVKVGDYVVAFAGETVHSTEDILRLRRDLRVGDEVVIRVWRDDGYLDLTMTMRADSGSTAATDPAPSTDQADPQPDSGDDGVDVEPR